MRRDRSPLMGFLLKHRDNYKTEEEFRSFVLETVRDSINDLRELGIEISIRPQCLQMRTAPSHAAGPDERSLVAGRLC